jgi:hypothetical protein
MMIRICALAAWAVLTLSAPAAAGENRLDHNGSMVTYIVRANQITIKYVEPRPELRGIGVVSGTTLFQGLLLPDWSVAGVAYSFARGCAPTPYQVRGRVTAQSIVLQGAAPQRAYNDCRITAYGPYGPNSLLVFRPSTRTALAARKSEPTPAALSSQARADAPIVLDWTPDVGSPKHPMVPVGQFINEALPRHVYVSRVGDDRRELHIAWQVGPMKDDPYPAKPNLFGSETYPSGQVTLAPRQRKADIVVRTVSTGVPDWHRDFEVRLTDADTGAPVVDRSGRAIAVGFAVAGDLKCAPGHPDLCDAAELPSEAGE